MLRAHRSTFKPDSGACLTRGDTGPISPESQGLGNLSDAGRDSGDDFFEFGSPTPSFSQIFNVPSESKILRIFVSAKGGDAVCYSVPDSCETGSVLCPAGGPCCGCVEGLCCNPDTGECSVLCQDECDQFPNACFRTDIDSKTPQEVIDEACTFCGRSACCTGLGGAATCTPGPLCFNTKGELDDCEPSSCQEDADCGVAGSWICRETSGVPDCKSGESACQECFFDPNDDTGSATQSECQKNCSGTPQVICCSGSCYDQGAGEEPPLGCNGNAFCNRDDCERCCTSFNRTTGENENSPYASLATIPGPAKPGDTLTTAQRDLFNAGVKRVGLQPAVSFVNITLSVAQAYNARRQAALSANIEPRIDPSSSETSENINSSRGTYTNAPYIQTIDNTTVDQEQFFGDFCDVCATDGTNNGGALGEESCGVQDPAMFILEYNLGELCTITDLRVVVTRYEKSIEETTWQDSDEEVVNVALQYYNTRTAAWETLLADLATRGYITIDPNPADPEFNCTTCEFEFSCGSLGLEFVHGRYPTFEIPIATEYAGIPAGQAEFDVAGGKTQNIRTSNHTIESVSGSISASIVTGIIGTGRRISIYTDINDSDRVDILEPGASDATSLANAPDVVANRLKWDVDRISSESAGGTYIYGDASDGLIHPYGVSGNGLCTSPGQSTNPGDPLFGMIAGSTATYVA